MYGNPRETIPLRHFTARVSALTGLERMQPLTVQELDILPKR
jgi:hypothetical protein